MISTICCFTKSAVIKWAHISETPPNQPDYPWFSKCTFKLGLEKPMLINSTDMSHLTLSATGLNDNITFLENVKQGFKITISGNKYKSEITTLNKK